MGGGYVWLGRVGRVEEGGGIMEGEGWGIIVGCRGLEGVLGEG